MCVYLGGGKGEGEGEVFLVILEEGHDKDNYECVI